MNAPAKVRAVSSASATLAAWTERLAGLSMVCLVVFLAIVLSACARAPLTTGSVERSQGPALNGTTLARHALAAREMRDLPPPMPRTVHVALLVPKGRPDDLGETLEEAARLALRDHDADSIAAFRFSVHDTGSETAQVEAATRAALEAGASLLVGPVYAADVASASAIARSRGVPMLALTSDTGRKGDGVYLNSFTPEADVERIVTHAASLGSRHIVAFVPRTRYGALALKTARAAIEKGGGQIALVSRYDGTPGGFLASARAAAVAVEGADTVWIPEGGKVPRAILRALKASGVALEGKRVLGSGQWRGAAPDPLMEGAIFASNDTEAFRTFAYRYEAKTTKKPPVVAGLAYDAVATAVTLARSASRHATISPFSRQAIETNAGFTGATGLFRFRADGSIERRLAIFRVEKGRPVLASRPNAGFRTVRTAAF